MEFAFFVRSSMLRTFCIWEEKKNRTFDDEVEELLFAKADMTEKEGSEQ